MEEEMIRLQYVMPVELAIKREIEYRTKMEVLKNLRQNSLTPLLPLQKPTPRKREAKARPQSSNSQGTHMLQPSSSCQPFPKPPSGLICIVCRVAFASVFHLKQHGATQEHKSLLFQMKRMGENISNPFQCDLCKASSSSASEMARHLNGARHAGSLKMFEEAKRARAQRVFDCRLVDMTSFFLY